MARIDDLDDGEDLSLKERKIDLELQKLRTKFSEFQENILDVKKKRDTYGKQTKTYKEADIEIAVLTRKRNNIKSKIQYREHKKALIRTGYDAQQLLLVPNKLEELIEKRNITNLEIKKLRLSLLEKSSEETQREITINITIRDRISGLIRYYRKKEKK